MFVFDVLRDVRVVDLTSGAGGAYLTKLFADAGADVVLVEPDGGSALRSLSRTATLPDGVEDGVLFRFLAAGKTSVLGTLGDPEMLDLLRAADVVVEDLPAGTIEATGLLDPLTNVVVSLSPYGRGPYEHLPGNDFTAQAVGGGLGCRGLPTAEPIHAAGRITELAAGIYGAPAALAAVMHRRRSGRGAHIDVSGAEAMMICTNLFQDLMFRMLGGVPPVPGRMIMFPGIEQTADGWIGLNTNSRQKLDDLLSLVECGDLVGDPGVLTDPAKRAVMQDTMQRWLRARPTDEILEVATAMRIPAAPIGNGATVPTIDHFVERGIFDDSVLGFTAPRPYYSIAGARPGPSGRAPRRPELGPAAVLGRWTPRPTAVIDDGSMPLAGLKVLDLTAWWAGPSATQFLAALGADVVHVESIQTPDGMRAAGSLPFASLPDWWERSSFFLSINPNKRDLTLDLGTEAGRALARELVGWADVMVENFTPRVVDSWGLDWDHVTAINPRLIQCRMPAFGLDGPWSDRVGFAQTMEQVSGLSWSTGYEGGDPVMPNGPCDPLGGMHAAFAILVALERRAATGTGALIECPLVESALNLAAEEVLEYAAYGRVGERHGNRSRERAPQGVYRCQGDERWLALSVEDHQWGAFVDALGSPAWALAPEMATVDGRFAAHDEIDRELAVWCADRDRDGLFAMLTARGVTAAPVHDQRSVTEQEPLLSRGFAEWCDHPAAGRIPVPAMPFRWSGIDRWVHTPAPTLGQHNHEVLAGILGRTEAEIAELEAAKVIGTRPAWLADAP